ncbi:MAG: ribosome-associated translation inhibitor RaiA [Candidatus Krumholzibacteriota bacterium]|nr:ribosome-associated translation inhibitor RaiA [Candidatus Krumholzibacteriota bacterium]
MELTTTSRHFKASPELIEHIEVKMRKLKRYFENILNVDVIMSVEKVRHIAEVNLHVQGHNFTAIEESDNMFFSIDKCEKDLERQIKKYRGKLQSRYQNHKRSKREQYPREYIISAGSVESENGVEMIEEAAYDLENMNVEEAIKAMKKQEKEFFFFDNTESGNPSFVYRRSDGNYGVIKL